MTAAATKQRRFSNIHLEYGAMFKRSMLLDIAASRKFHSTFPKASNCLSSIWLHINFIECVFVYVHDFSVLIQKSASQPAVFLLNSWRKKNMQQNGFFLLTKWGANTLQTFTQLVFIHCTIWVGGDIQLTFASFSNRPHSIVFAISSLLDTLSITS